jgi:protein-S-isoprenylcysteine O-methyltransferase Ste14
VVTARHCGPGGGSSAERLGAALLFIWAGVVSHASALTLAIGLAATGVAAARVIAEERLLRAAYPDYRDYARDTKAFVPYLF